MVTKRETKTLERRGGERAAALKNGRTNIPPTLKDAPDATDMTPDAKRMKKSHNRPPIAVFCPSVREDRQIELFGVHDARRGFRDLVEGAIDKGTDVWFVPDGMAL